MTPQGVAYRGKNPLRDTQSLRINAAGEEGALRLTDGGNGDSGDPQRGILEIFHAGAWGSVCRPVRGPVNRGGFADGDDDPPLPEV